MDKEMTRLTKTYAYFCPICGTYSGDMNLKSEKRKAAEEELRRELHLATELLLCTCGRTWSWFDLEERFMGFVDYENMLASDISKDRWRCLIDKGALFFWIERERKKMTQKELKGKDW